MTITNLDPGRTVTCIRRWYAVNPSCRCPDCVVLHRRQRKLTDAGLITRIPPEQAWAVIDDLLAQDWTPSAIASACGMPDRAIFSALDDRRHHGHSRAWGPTAARRIVTYGTPTRGYVGSTGASRRVQALVAIAWPGYEIAARTGTTPMTISHLSRQRWPRVLAKTNNAIRDVYADLAHQHLLTGARGPSEKAARIAAKHRWAPPYAWDDIDDPACEPLGLAWCSSTTNERHAAFLDDALEIAARGETWEAAALLLGKPNAEAVMTYARNGGNRLGRQDDYRRLCAQLTANTRLHHGKATAV